MANPGGFDKDFGYLMPFLDKVAAAASQLPDAGARAELQKLMGEEKQRWARARQLLAGAQAQGTDAGAAAPPAARPGSPRVQAESPRLTVGSLKPSR